MVILSNLFQEIQRNPNLFLAILTAIYVVITFLILNTNQRFIKANLMPIFFPQISLHGSSLQFKLTNYSLYPAYDVDIWLIGIYDEESVPHKSLLQKKYKKEIKINFENTLFKKDEFDFYGIRDRACYSAFPPKSQCLFSPQFSKMPEQLHLILQFRDAMGKNYLYQAWLYREGKKENYLKMGYLNYSLLKAVGRIDFDCFLDGKEIYEIAKITNFINFFRLWCSLIINKIRVYIRLDKSIKDILKRVIPAGYQEKFKNCYYPPEDRGKFMSVD